MKKKKGLFGGLFGQKDSKKSSGCCNIEFEEIKDEKTDNQSNKDNQECNKSCCK